MIDKKILEHVTKYNISKGWTTDEKSIVQTIRESNHIYSALVDSHRWWDIYLCVVKIDGMFIGFYDGYATGDDHAEDVGFSFETESIMEYEPQEIKKTIYIPK
jgi:hypothetical protein